MYDFLDRRIASLDAGGRFLIWSMRTWVKTMEEKRCPPSALGSTFARWRMDRGLADFHIAMMILNKEATSKIGFSPLGCAHVCEDEAILLQLFRSLCLDDGAMVRATLGMLVPEESVATLLTAMTRVSIRLAVAGLVPGRPADHRHVREGGQ